MAHSNRIQKYQREDALVQVGSVIGGHLIIGFLALAGNHYQFAGSPHAVICLAIAVMVFSANKLYSWNSTVLNWSLVIGYLVLTTAEFAVYGLPASMLEFRETYSKGAMLDGIMYMVPYIYAGIRFGMVLPLVAVSRHTPRNSSPVSTDQ
jgi:hypothetical protein